MDVPEQMLRLFFTVGAVVFMAVATKAITALVVKPRRIRYMLRKQGIVGPPPSFLLGNLKEFRQCNASRVPQSPQDMTHNCSSKLFSFMDRWRAEYGSTFLMFFGNIPILYTYNMDIVREITKCTSLDLGKPSYQFKKIGPLLGHGVLTSNGAASAHQRKIIAPELYLDKVKANKLGMIGLIVESSVSLLDSWNQMIQEQAGKIDITIDKHMSCFSAEVISRACFGSNYAKGEEIFLRLRRLEEVLLKNVMSSGFSNLKYIPSRRNREIWRMEKEVRSLILDVVNERSRLATSENDLLQMILEGVKSSDFSRAEMDRFIVDNCKNIYLAGYETTAVSATWTLMLLASSPKWQHKVRDEVTEVCGGKLPDATAIGKMKVLAMVINESLRLYKHSPIMRLILEPEYGVDLIVEAL
ncbi:hypothetical protein MLD38_011233 [Melastoma candidum]|uniref:Uncharacterized protein n=1 Tax=Melastoma candidum TaxID=119954 RepID=A0ACB9R2X6_9MYRT|nr:hypothetical protein MLD38_011233 [Melastoma candidum]